MGECRFYRRDAMLTRVIAVARCLSVCLSVRHKSVLYRTDWTDRAGFGSVVEMCHQLSSRKVDAESVINWAVVGRLS